MVATGADMKGCLGIFRDKMKHASKPYRKEKVMKKSTWLSVAVSLSILSVLFLAGLVTNARGDEERNKTIAKEGAAGAPVSKGGYSEEKEKFKNETRKKLVELGKKMDELEAKAKETGSKVKAEAKEELQELKKKRTALREDLEKLEASSKEMWESVKNKFKKELDELEKKYDKLRSKFK